MPNPQRELPNEIIKIIFLNLPKKARGTISKKNALSQCALTCSSWRLVAQSLIFHSLTLKNEKDIEDINSMLLHNCMIEQWTRCLRINFIVSKSSILIAIDKLLPHIEEIFFPATAVYSRYDRFEPQRLDPAYSFLYELHAKDNKFNNLRILPIPTTIKQHQLYVECLYVIRNRIADIKIYDVEDSYNRLLYANLCNNLHLFPHLKSVTASVEENMSLDVIEYCESLLTKKNLSSIFLQELTIQITNSSYVDSSTLLEEQDKIFPASNIKRVVISIEYEGDTYQELEEPGDKFMIYIMKKFPNLNFLELVGDHMGSPNFKRIRRIPLLKNEGPNRIKQLPDVICQFLNYIYKIPNCCLQDLVVSKEYTVQIIEELFKGIITNSDRTYYNWEEHSFITLDAKISPEYSKIDACLFIPNWFLEVVTTDQELIDSLPGSGFTWT